MTSATSIEKLVADAKVAGINTLIVQVRGRGDAYYRSRWEPRSPALKEEPESFDPLATVLAKAHPAGIKVHAWLNTHLLANLNELPTEPDHVYIKHPEWLAVPRRIAGELYGLPPADPKFRERIPSVSKEDLRELEGIYTSPSNPAVKEHIYNVFMDIVEKYDVDGVHFDYVRFPNPDFDYSKTALDRFRASVEPGMTPEERRLASGLLQSRPLVYGRPLRMGGCGRLLREGREGGFSLGAEGTGRENPGVAPWSSYTGATPRVISTAFSTSRNPLHFSLSDQHPVEGIAVNLLWQRSAPK